MKDFLISMVIPVYEEEQLIYNNVMVIKNILEENNYKYEFIIIDDGSKDNTFSELKRLSLEIPSLIAIKFSKNFGKEAALCAGLNKVSGDIAIVMDADLQHPPKIIPKMVKLWKEDNYDVVDGVKKSRGKESFFSFFTAGIFYKILHKSSGINLKNASDYKLLDKKVIEAWKKMPERDTFFRAMSFWVGFNRTSITFEVATRTDGKSKWSFITLFKLAITAITSFSALPLHIVTVLGIAFLIGSVIMGIHTLYMKFSGIAVSGFTTVILLLLITGSALMISLGVIGIYISRIYEEVKARPRYIVTEIITEIIEEKH